MALSIKNDEVERLARELARRRQISVTEAIRQSLEREVGRDRIIPRDDIDHELANIRAIVESASRIPERDNPLNEDEVLGYDEFGAPTR
jgi:antitoxin VapB